jgi:shikimate dehydrogenase
MIRLGLIAYPVAHSFSKKYFGEKFRKLGISNYHYELYPLEKLSGLRDTIRNNNLTGFNVSIPHKESIIPFLSDLDISAEKTAAVNTVCVNYPEDGDLYLKGYNTDAQAFKESLPQGLKYTKALILGSGGASKAIAYTLNQMHIDFYFVSRSPENKRSISYKYLADYMHAGYHFIINATPLGTFPDVEKAAPIPWHLVTKDYFFYDLVYNPSLSFFLKQAKKQHAHVMNGLKMLYLQAEKAWEIWMDHVNREK